MPSVLASSQAGKSFSHFTGTPQLHAHDLDPELAYWHRDSASSPQLLKPVFPPNKAISAILAFVLLTPHQLMPFAFFSEKVPEDFPFLILSLII